MDTYWEPIDNKRQRIMKTIIRISTIFLVLALIFMAFTPLFTKTVYRGDATQTFIMPGGLNLDNVTSDDRDKVILMCIKQSLENGHYEHIVFNDAFSSKVFDEYLSKLDYAKRFLLKSDVEMLSKYRYSIDDEIREARFGLYDTATAIIKKRQEQAAEYYREAISGKFDFTAKEFIHTNPDSTDYAANEKVLRDNWRKLTKFAVLEKIADQLSIQEKAIKDKDTSYKVKPLDSIKANAIARVKESYDAWMKRLAGIKEIDWMSTFLNSIVGACDPHSEYLPPEDKKNFDISMSGKFEGIGATLQNRNGQTKVMDIIPGSASWRQGELEVNDIIIKVGQGDAEPVDITNMELDDAVKLIRGKKGTTVKLTVKKIDGTIQIIPIVRDVVVIEETYAKSSVLTSKDGHTRVGYVYLPKFYADFNDKNGRFCSKDVKIELEKLASENVDGVILDLRNNGGGSLSDVVDMSGLFINNGPIVQVKTRDGSIRHFDDPDPAISYKGPMVVMVNNFSASASEILAAALQDYDRAIIMGSQSSFGKGTVQSVIDFDRYVQGNQSIKPLGALKLTIQKFYRIDGGTTQLKGVIPDIVLPDTYAYMNVGEKESNNALPFDVIAKSSYIPWVHHYDKETIINESRRRIDANPIFKQIDDNARRLKKRSDESTYSLNLEAYRNYQKKIKDEADKYGKIGDEKTGVQSAFLAYDKAATEGDSIKTKKFTKWFESLEKDIYISEAINVIGDMVANMPQAPGGAFSNNRK